MKRFEDWPERLAAYLNAHAEARFQWGVCDCALFVAGAICAMTGEDPGAEFRHRYSTAAGAMREMRRFAGGGVAALARKIAAQSGLEEIPVATARRGDAVLVSTERGEALGIIATNGREALFIERTGIVSLPLSVCATAWRIP